MDNVTDFTQAELLAHIYGPTEIMLNLSVAFIMAILIAFVYRKTHKGLSYSQSFILTLVFVCIVTALVIMVVGNNVARAFALVGALSIIRFRTVVKDTKDTAFVFLSLAVGLAAGTSSYFAAIFGTIFFSVIAVILDQINFGTLYKSEFLLRFRVKRDTKEDYNSLISSFTKSHSLVHLQPSGDDLTNKITLDVIMKKDIDPNSLVNKLEDIKDISEVLLIASAKDPDY